MGLRLKDAGDVKDAEGVEGAVVVEGVEDAECVENADDAEGVEDAEDAEVAQRAERAEVAQRAERAEVAQRAQRAERAEVAQATPPSIKPKIHHTIRLHIPKQSSTYLPNLQVYFPDVTYHKFLTLVARESPRGNHTCTQYENGEQ